MRTTLGLFFIPIFRVVGKMYKRFSTERTLENHETTYRNRDKRADRT